MPVDRRFGFRIFVPAWRALLLGFVLTVLFASGSIHRPASSVNAQPPLNEQQVCSLLDPNNEVGILGQDGGESIEAEGKVFWTFGDTTVDFIDPFYGGLINTSAAHTTDFEASDCIRNLIYKTNDDGNAKVLMVRGDTSVNLEEWLVWASGMAHVEPGHIHTFYISVEHCEECPLNFRVGGIGLAKFDTTDLDTDRIEGLIWDNDNLGPGERPVSNPMTMVHDGYVYIFIDQRVARVPATKADLEDPTNYEYWNGTGWVNDFAQAVDLWVPESPINGLSVRYNDYLDQFLAVYTTGTPDYPWTVVAARTASSITGPWSEEFVLIDCLDYFPLSIRDDGEVGLTCYSGIQHDEYEKNNGQTIYVTHANDEDYRLFLYEITFQPYTVNHSVPKEEKETYSSAASAKMIIDYMNSGISEPSIAALTQADIHDYGAQYNQSANPPDSELDPNGMDAVLGHFDPYDIAITSPYDSYDSRADGNPYQGYNFTVNAHTDIETYMRDIAHWMDYPVPTYWGSSTLANPDRVPPAVPVFGNYSNWMVVNGFSASADPLPNPDDPFFTPDFTLFGFWLTDPNENGIGANRFVSAEEAANTYLEPVESNDSYDGKFVQVAEPPPVESDGELTVASGDPTEAGNLSTEPEESVAAAIAGLSPGPTSAMQASEVDWDSVIPDDVQDDPGFGPAYEGSTPAEVMGVHRPDGGADYHIVTFEKDGKTSAALIVTQSDGVFLEATWVAEPEDYGWLTEEQALDILEYRGLLSPDDAVSTEFIWEPGEVSSSPFEPYWRVSSDDVTVHVRSDGSLVGDPSLIGEDPVAKILEPADLAEFTEGETIGLEGFGHDPQDGFVGSSLAWTARSVDTLAQDLATADAAGALEASLSYSPQFIVEVWVGKTSDCEGLACFAASTIDGMTLSGLEPGREYKVAVCVQTGCQYGELAYYIGTADPSGNLNATFGAYTAQAIVEIWVVKTTDCSGLGCFASSSIEAVGLAGLEAGRQYRTAVCPQSGCSSGPEAAIGSGETVEVSDLPAGTHIISLTAKDGDGNDALHEIQIRILSPP